MTTPTEADVRRKIAKLEERKASLLEEARTMNKRARLEGRDLTLGEEHRFDTMIEEVHEINAEIETGWDLVIVSRPSGRNEAWRRRTFSLGAPEKRI